MSYAGLPISFDSPTSSSVQNFSYTQPHLANKIVFSGQKPSDEFITDAPRQTNWPSFYRQFHMPIIKQFKAYSVRFYHFGDF